jgi:hypothetical protein
MDHSGRANHLQQTLDPTTHSTSRIHFEVVMADTRLPAAATASSCGRSASVSCGSESAKAHLIRHTDPAGRAESSPHRWRARLLALPLVLCASLTACKADAPVPEATARPAPAPTREAIEQQAAAPAELEAPARAEASSATNTPAARILATYAAANGREWSAWETVAGVTWNDPAPIATPDAMDAADAQWRSGRFQWRFATPPVSERDLDVGLTLIGAAAVDAISLRRFRPSSDYADALRSQFDTALELTPIAGRCSRNDGTAAPNDRETAFFAVRAVGPATLYMEAYVDREAGKTGPGYTTYTFTRDEPTARIRDMGCVRG